MSKELIGKNGKVVGSIEYLSELNKGCMLSNMVGNYKYNYYDVIKSTASKCVKMIDKVHHDLNFYKDDIILLNDKDKCETIEIIKGMSDLCVIARITSTKADKCINLLATKRSSKLKSGASNSDVEKSANFVLKNKHYNKRDSIAILASCIKNGEKIGTNKDPKKQAYINEVKISSKNGYLEDVRKRVMFKDKKRTIADKDHKILCSKDYNRNITSVIMKYENTKGKFDFGNQIRESFKYIYKTIENDLSKGIKDNDYIVTENADNLKKLIKDVVNCGEKNYNLTTSIDKLSWFIGGDKEKILKLQKMLNAQTVTSVKLLEDGVFGRLTKSAWLSFISQVLDIEQEVLLINGIKNIIFSKEEFKKSLERGPVVTDDDGKNLVLGFGYYNSFHIMGGVSAGQTIYIDDKLNIAIMNTTVLNATANVEFSQGLTFEISTTASSVSDMSGWSTTGAGSFAPVLIEKLIKGVNSSNVTGPLGVSLGHSDADGSDITADSFSVSYGKGVTLSDINFGRSYSSPIVQFNPIKWIESYIGI